MSTKSSRKVLVKTKRAVRTLDRRFFLRSLPFIGRFFGSSYTVVNIGGTIYKDENGKVLEGDEIPERLRPKRLL
jgi:hypothetical protein